MRIEAAEWYRLNREEGLSFREIARRYGLSGRGAVARAVADYHKSLPASSPAEAVPTGEKISDQQQANSREIESSGPRITTLNQLLDACKINLEEWIVERHVVNTWEVGRRDTRKEITWNDGVANGFAKDSGGVNVETLFQVKAWLVRRTPEAVKPVIRPVNVSLPAEHRAHPHRQGMKAALIVPDTQFGFTRDHYRNTLTPFHDRRALDLVIQLAEMIEPDVTIFLGDVNDYSGWSDKYIKRPEFYFTTQPALIEANWYIGQLRRLTSGEMYVIEGNHDLRPEKQIITHLMDAYDLKSADHLDAAPVMSVDNLLGLSRMGVEYKAGYPDAEVWLNENTRITHGERVRGTPGGTAGAVVQAASETTIFGHIHRREYATRTIAGRGGHRTIAAYSPGCLCHIDGRVPGSKKTDNWQQGAAVVWYDEQRSSIQSVEIENGEMVWGGELLTGSDYSAELRQAFPEWSF